MELEDDSSTNIIPEHLRILTAINKNDRTHLPWQLICNSNSFTLIVNFCAKGNDKGKQVAQRATIAHLSSHQNILNSSQDKKNSIGQWLLTPQSLVKTGPNSNLSTIL